MNNELIDKFIESLIKKTLANSVKWENLREINDKSPHKIGFRQENINNLSDDSIPTSIIERADFIKNVKRNMMFDLNHSFLAKCEQGNILIIDEIVDEDKETRKRFHSYILYISSKDTLNSYELISSKESSNVYSLVNAIENHDDLISTKTFVDNFIEDFLRD